MDTAVEVETTPAVGSRRRIIVAAVALACVVLLAFSYWRSTSTYYAHLNGYRVGPGPNDVTLLYLAGAEDDDYSAEVIQQDGSIVKVQVTGDFERGLTTQAGWPKESTVTLDAPLGERKVVDREGVEVPRE